MQYSVFECILPKSKLRELVKRIERHINLREDSIRIYHLCSVCQTQATIIGQGKVTEDKDVYIL